MISVNFAQILRSRETAVARLLNPPQTIDGGNLNLGPEHFDLSQKAEKRYVWKCMEQSTTSYYIRQNIKHFENRLDNVGKVYPLYVMVERQ
jgi:hypothetical protein